MQQTENDQSNRSECEVLIREAFVKITQIILQARLLPEKELYHTKRSSLFMLDLAEMQRLNEHLLPWCNDIYRPLILETFLATHNREGPLLEQWLIVYKPLNKSVQIEISKVNQALAVLMRSLYSFVRITHIYQLCKELKKKAASNFRINFVLKQEKDGLRRFAGTSGQYNLATTKTSYGRLSVSLRYNLRPSFALDQLHPLERSAPIGILSSRSTRDSAPYSGHSHSHSHNHSHSRDGHSYTSGGATEYTPAIASPAHPSNTFYSAQPIPDYKNRWSGPSSAPAASHAHPSFGFCTSSFGSPALASPSPSVSPVSPSVRIQGKDSSTLALKLHANADISSHLHAHSSTHDPLPLLQPSTPPSSGFPSTAASSSSPPRPPHPQMSYTPSVRRLTSPFKEDTLAAHPHPQSRALLQTQPQQPYSPAMHVLSASPSPSPLSVPQSQSHFYPSSPSLNCLPVPDVPASASSVQDEALAFALYERSDEDGEVARFVRRCANPPSLLMCSDRRTGHPLVASVMSYYEELANLHRVLADLDEFEVG
jgi:hypothetical protein